VLFSRDEAEREFLARVKVIERFARGQAWRRHFSKETSEDFVSEVMTKFIEHDYKRLRKLRGESSVEAFLATTVANLAKDFTVALWGKCRTSPAARRLGDVAVQLELLLMRDGMSFDVACEVLWSRGVKLTRKELEALAAQLPHRTTRRFESIESAFGLLSDEPAPDTPLAQQEAARTAARVKAVLVQTFKSWTPEDQLLFTMRYKDGKRIPEIARVLGKPAHPLYHRADRLLAMLRTALEAAGLDAQAVLGMLRHWIPDFGWNPEKS